MSKRRDKALQELSARCGIATEYLDYRKELTVISPEARLNVLRCMGYTGDEKGARRALARAERDEWLSVLPATLLQRAGEPLCISLSLPADLLDAEMQLLVRQETGEVLERPFCATDYAESATVVLDGTTYSRRSVSIEVDLADGYHRLLLISSDGKTLGNCALIIAPRTCFQQQELEDGKRIFGIGLQLYTLRSARNWGIGDFTDLRNFVVDAAKHAVDIVGVNPLHALFPSNPLHFSPYSPSNRGFINVMYIDVEAVAEYAGCSEARLRVDDSGFQRRLTALRETDYVEYEAVANCKFAVLELLFRHFVTNHLEHDTEHARAYRQWVSKQGSALTTHCTYDALHEYFFSRDFNLWGWPVWPEEFRSPDSSGTREFARDNALRVEYYQYLQWVAYLQLEAAQAAAVAAGMTVGIYLDVAIGVDQSGSEVWAHQDQYCLQASTGAPPDALAREGQDWGFPPFDPVALKESAYELFVSILRANMAIAGAVRFDHAVALLRLWWIPQGSSSKDGAYVAYPLEELLGILALQSRRQCCLVIGEDLGTVPAELTRVMEENHLYSYRVLYFEKEGKDSRGAMIPPQHYPREAAATVTTHDLPTLASWWDESDIELRAQLGLFPTQELVDQMIEDRRADKQHLLEALATAGLWAGTAIADQVPEMTQALNEAVHLYLGASGASVMLAQLDDMQGLLEPVNVPGTFQERRNWQRKVDLPIEGFFDWPEAVSLCRALAKVRKAQLQA